MIDHRKLGRELELFGSDPLIGAGLPYWLPAGAAARGAVERYIQEVERRAGYQHVYSPPLAHRELYEISGHWANFAPDMYPPMSLSSSQDVAGGGSEELVLRPAICPHHAVMFRSRGRSYRELPLRMAELGGMYRAERSGVLGGLSRVRAIWLNDAHIFCAPEQVGGEVAAALALIDKAHHDLGVPAATYRLSLRGPGNKYAGSDEAWHRAELHLREALRGKEFVEAPGEAAFYGPKIDVQVVDPAGRESTLSTVQVDFHQPEAFELSYVDSGGRKARPVMVHRSIIGSLERLFAHLIEVHAGSFPAWYAPVQVRVLPIGEAQHGAAQAFARRCVESGLRADVADEGTLGARIRENRRVPALAIVGPDEVERHEIALRWRNAAPASHPTGDALAALVDACAPPV